MTSFESHISRCTSGASFHGHLAIRYPRISSPCRLGGACLQYRGTQRYADTLQEEEGLSLAVLLDCGYFKAMMITIIGALVRMLCGRAFVYTTVLGQQPGIESSIIVGLSVLRGFLI